MSPDLQYFLIADTSYRGFSHSWLGLFVFCLPAGVVFSFVFHRLFKFQAISALPWFLERRFTGLAESRFEIRGVQQWLVFLGSIFIGALSHFVWDSFTHPGGEVVHAIALLSRPVEIFGLSRPVCRWLQHLSSLWGGVFVLYFLFRSRLIPPPTRNRPLKRPATKALFWIGAILASLACTFTMIWFYNDWYNWHLEQGHNFSLGVITAGLASWAGFFYFVCAYTAISKLVGQRLPASRQP
jgi:hypothetical protein